MSHRFVMFVCCISILYLPAYSEDDSSLIRLQEAVIRDTLLDVKDIIEPQLQMKKYTFKMRSRYIGSAPVSHTLDCFMTPKFEKITTYIHEGCVYNTTLPGRHFPLFDTVEFQINHNGTNVIVEPVADNWDEILGYTGVYIFDETDRRRHIHDSSFLHSPQRQTYIKK